VRIKMVSVDKFMLSTQKKLEFLGGIGCFVLMLCVVLEVLSRYVFEKVIITGLYNITESYIFPSLTFLAFAGSYRIGMWPNLDIFINKMTPTKKRWVKLSTLGIEFVLYSIVAIFTLNYSYEMTLENRMMQAGSATYPLYPILWVVPLAFFLLLIEILLRISKELKTA